MNAHSSPKRHDDILTALSEVGMDLAHNLVARAEAARSGEEAAALALAFERVARGVQLSIALQRRLRQEALADHAERAEVRKAQVVALPPPKGRPETLN